MLVSLGIGLAAFFAGAIVVWIVLAGRAAAARESIARLQETARQLSGQAGERQAALERASSEAEQSRKAAETARIEAAELRTSLQLEKNSADEKLAVLLHAREDLSNQFKALANEILEQKAKTFTEQNQANLTQVLTPLREKFGEFQQKVESLEKDGITGRTELRTQIEQLRTLNERLSADAANLVTALKGSSKTQGDWGELVLEKLLESAGLRRDVEYRVQKTFGREEGGNARLDVILDLPEDRHLVIDSKVSLNAYTDYCNTDGEETRKQALRQHLQSVRAHLKELSAREYQDLYGLKSLDFVLMFVPVEPAFMVAIANDSRLWQDAYDKNVLLVSPSGLLCVVRTVAQIWRQERQSRNVEEIAKRGRILYDKFVGFVEDLQKIGGKLGDARAAYESAYNKLARADGNLVSQAQKLVRLGVKPNKALPQPLLDQAEQSDEMLELAAVSDERGDAD
mgnify:CR=1 FL=1